jgi:nucleoid DNA-binding protein
MDGWQNVEILAQSFVKIHAAECATQPDESTAEPLVCLASSLPENFGGKLIDFKNRDCHLTRDVRWWHPQRRNQPPEYPIRMNKAELVATVQKTLGKGASKAQAERAVDAVIDGIKSGLKKGKPVQLVGFGTFKIANRKARMGINPKTGQPLKIKASKNVKFAAGKDLKSKLR